jgi:hypothetical protein
MKDTAATLSATRARAPAPKCAVCRRPGHRFPRCPRRAKARLAFETYARARVRELLGAP